MMWIWYKKRDHREWPPTTWRPDNSGTACSLRISFVWFFHESGLNWKATHSVRRFCCAHVLNAAKWSEASINLSNSKTQPPRGLSGVLMPRIPLPRALFIFKASFYCNVCLIFVKITQLVLCRLLCMHSVTAILSDPTAGTWTSAVRAIPDKIWTKLITIDDNLSKKILFWVKSPSIWFYLGSRLTTYGRATRNVMVLKFWHRKVIPSPAHVAAFRCLSRKRSLKLFTVFAWPNIFVTFDKLRGTRSRHQRARVALRPIPSTDDAPGVCDICARAIATSLCFHAHVSFQLESQRIHRARNVPRIDHHPIMTRSNAPNIKINHAPSVGQFFVFAVAPADDGHQNNFHHRFTRC